MDDEICIPFVFVRHGDPPPYEWMRQHPDWIKIPALFVPHSVSESSRRAAVAAFYGWPAPDSAGADEDAGDWRSHSPILPIAASAGQPPEGYVAPNPQQWIGQPSVGDGECVALVRQASGAPSSRTWKPGAFVAGNLAIRPGTIIATFDANGHYAGHTAIYLGQDAIGIHVIDQWNIRDPEGHIKSQHTPSERPIRFNSDRNSDVVDQGEYYRVVE